jgi:uncharacterized membrane protein
MQFSADVLSSSLAWSCVALAAVVLAYALPALRAVPRSAWRVHLVAGAVLWLGVLWSMHARLDPGMSLHVLGTPAVVLLLGWRLGIVAAALAELGLVLFGVTALLYAPASWLVSAVVPGAVMLGIAWTARFYLPRNPFVFIAGAFFGGGLALLAAWIVSIVLLGWSGQPAPSGAGTDLSALLPLVLFPEASLNGAAITLLIVCRPDWVRLYDEAFYVRS